jgi:hypothetical protein
MATGVLTASRSPVVKESATEGRKQRSALAS